MKRTMFSIILFLLAPACLLANTYTFRGTTNTFWNVATNWSGGVIAPVVLPAGDSVIFTADCDINIPSLTIYGSLSYTNTPLVRIMQGTSLIISSTGSAALYYLTNELGTVQIDGRFKIDNFITNSGSISINSSSVNIASLSNTTTGLNHGSIIINSTGIVNIYGSFLYNPTGGLFTVNGILEADNNVQTSNNGQLLINAGAKYLQRGTNYAINTEYFTNSLGGKIINKGIIELKSRSSNSGYISNTGNGKFFLKKETFTNGGTFVVDTFSEFSFDLASYFANKVAFYNYGMISGQGEFLNWGFYIGGAGSLISPASTSTGTLLIYPLTSPVVFDFAKSTFRCDIGGITAGITYDQVASSSPVNLSNASLDVNWSSYSPVAGQSFTIMTFPGRTGQFASVNIPPVPGLAFTLQYNATSIVIITIKSSLPLHLLSFDGEVKQGKAVLNWKTDNEEGTDHFEIERSSDGVTFKTTGSVSSFNTAGQHQYNFTDMQNLQSNTYYRLRQVDRDGQYNYSQVIRLSVAAIESKVRLYPNPASGVLIIESLERDMLNKGAVLIDMTGNTVLSILITRKVQQVDIGHLSSGVYRLQFQNGITRTIIKQ